MNDSAIEYNIAYQEGQFPFFQNFIVASLEFFNVGPLDLEPQA